MVKVNESANEDYTKIISPESGFFNRWFVIEDEFEDMQDLYMKYDSDNPDETLCYSMYKKFRSILIKMKKLEKVLDNFE